MVAPISQSTMMYLNILSQINAGGDPDFAISFINGFEHAIVNVPHSQNPTADPGYIIPTPDTPEFFNILSQHPLAKIWIYIKVAAETGSPDLSASTGLERIKRKVDQLWSWFDGAGLEQVITGFYFDGMGFDTGFGGQFMTRPQQNAIFDIAHSTYRKPVFAYAAYPLDLFTAVGPGARGSERGKPLWEHILGNDPVLTDRIELRNPMIRSWTDTTPTWSNSAMANHLGLDSYTRYKNLQLLPMQRFSWDNCTVDNKMGLIVDTTSEQLLARYCQFMRALGYYNFGAPEELANAIGTPATTTTKVINDKQISIHIFPQTDHVGSTRPRLYSRDNAYFVDNMIAEGEGAVAATHRFNSEFAYEQTL